MSSRTIKVKCKYPNCGKVVERENSKFIEGVGRVCFSCFNIWLSEQEKQNPDFKPNFIETKQCQVCNQELALKNFRKHGMTADGYRNKCRICEEKLEQMKKVNFKSFELDNEEILTNLNKLAPAYPEMSKKFHKLFKQMETENNDLREIIRFEKDRNVNLRKYVNELKAQLKAKCIKNKNLDKIWTTLLYEYLEKGLYRPEAITIDKKTQTHVKLVYLNSDHALYSVKKLGDLGVKYWILEIGKGKTMLMLDIESLFEKIGD